MTETPGDVKVRGCFTILCREIVIPRRVPESDKIITPAYPYYLMAYNESHFKKTPNNLANIL